LRPKPPDGRRGPATALPEKESTMRIRLPILLAAGLLVAAPIAASANDETVDIDSYHPLDLKAEEPPGPNAAVDSTGDHVVQPGHPADPALLNDPNVVKWPTLDKSVWEKYKNSYKFVPRH
jgi:hypothetical protein